MFVGSASLIGQIVRPRNNLVLKPSRYHLLGLIGQGQFGQVFCAVDRKTGALVALKDLDHRRFPTKQFLRELRFLLSLRHPNIVACQTLEHKKDSRYLVMDYCEGGTLRSLLESGERLSLTQTLKIITDILRGLEYAHKQEIIHCDIKPENILLKLEANSWTAQISDFGIARLSQEQMGSNSGATGSPAYMAPERFYGQYSPASDLYAVGVLLYEMIVGERPFSGVPLDLMKEHLNRSVKIPETVPFILRSLLTTALQKLPSRRFSSATEMLKSIQLAAEVEEITQTAGQLWQMPATQGKTGEFKSVQQEFLESPITHLVVKEQQVYLSMADQVKCRTYRNGMLQGALDSQWQVFFPQPPTQLYVSKQSCFVVTQSRLKTRDNYSFSLYELPRSGAPEPSTDALILFSALGERMFLNPDPNGQWLTYGISAADPILPAGNRPHQPIRLRFLRLAEMRQIASQVSVSQLSQLQVLNRRYGVAICQSSPEALVEAGSRLHIFNRRGQRVITFSLPVTLSHLTPSQGSASRSLALESSNPSVGLLIDFQPWRVQRIPLGIAPDFIRATPWGYVLANRQGQVVLLNDLGEAIADFQVPGTITAIAAFEVYGLLIATWQSVEGVLHTIDLRELKLNLIF
ncbi:MAG: serine/threonine protein kinase [Aphanocapsa sp. GSE-SYN-MK-11-07L]|jgi:serine/threonine-protein kinase|nr:serine/threonine protein kinase [Aphanocapsa sp. GSE-SYN-MK-11-07L]